MSSKTQNSILILGAGELGTAIINSLLHHPSYNPQTTPLTLLQRPSTISSTATDKVSHRDHLTSQGITLLPGDTDTDPLDHLTQLFNPYTTVIHATGMTSPPGTMTKITHAVIAAKTKFYIPWQHGVDYDIIGSEGGFGLFKEQVEVRRVLRSQTTTRWVIVSCGIFMSFLFEEFWGVVTKIANGIQVTALNSWDDVITTTTAKDIGLCTAELVLGDDRERESGPVFIAGDTLTYGEFADVVERVVAPGKLKRGVWPLPYLKEEYQKDRSDKLKQYRVVFAEGKGLSWSKEDTWNAKRGLQMQTVEEWLRENKGVI